jgi:hypothetical protein
VVVCGSGLALQDLTQNYAQPRPPSGAPPPPSLRFRHAHGPVCLGASRERPGRTGDSRPRSRARVGGGFARLDRGPTPETPRSAGRSTHPDGRAAPLPPAREPARRCRALPLQRSRPPARELRASGCRSEPAECVSSRTPVGFDVSWKPSVRPPRRKKSATSSAAPQPPCSAGGPTTIDRDTSAVRSRFPFARPDLSQRPAHQR